MFYGHPDRCYIRIRHPGPTQYPPSPKNPVCAKRLSHIHASQRHSRVEMTKEHLSLRATRPDMTEQAGGTTSMPMRRQRSLLRPLCRIEAGFASLAWRAYLIKQGSDAFHTAPLSNLLSAPTLPAPLHSGRPDHRTMTKSWFFVPIGDASSGFSNPYLGALQGPRPPRPLGPTTRRTGRRRCSCYACTRVHGGGDHERWVRAANGAPDRAG